MSSNLLMQSHLCSSLGPLESRDLGGRGIRRVSITLDCTVHTCVIVAIPARTRCVLTFSCSHTFAPHRGRWSRVTLVRPSSRTPSSILLTIALILTITITTGGNGQLSALAECSKN